MLYRERQVRTFIVFLNDKELGSMFCDEKCGACRHRFLCYTTNFSAALVIDNPDAYELSLQDGFFMRCPHCNGIFQLTFEQKVNNTKFKCPACHRYNWGSCEADEYGILIGELNGIS